MTSRISTLSLLTLGFALGLSGCHTKDATVDAPVAAIAYPASQTEIGRAHV